LRQNAIEQNRSNFIRPLYWQLPMPEPPHELAQLNFSYLKLKQPWWWWLLH
jgi:hypothetical protein